MIPVVVALVGCVLNECVVVVVVVVVGALSEIGVCVVASDTSHDGIHEFLDLQ